MITEIRLQIDDSIFLSLKEEKDAFTKDMLFEYALLLYRKHKLSLGKAAELAGYTRLEFIQKLQIAQEPIFDYDTTMIDEMINSAHTTHYLSPESQR